MKLTQKQLRKIVLSEARKLHENGEQSDVGMGAAEAVTHVILSLLDDNRSTLINDASHEWLGIEDPKYMMLPSRIEDLDHFADKLCSHVLNEPGLRQEISGIIRGVLREMMTI